MRAILLWFFKNRRTGAITVAQAPNALLWTCIAASLLGWTLPPDGGPRAISQGVGRGALILWAIDEMARGINPWRRCLGAATLFYSVNSLGR